MGSADEVALELKEPECRLEVEGARSEADGGLGEESDEGGEPFGIEKEEMDWGSMASWGPSKGFG